MTDSGSSSLFMLPASSTQTCTVCFELPGQGRALLALGAAAERCYAPKYRSISSSRSVIALLGK